jgi:hypothetical protein
LTAFHFDSSAAAFEESVDEPLWNSTTSTKVRAFAISGLMVGKKVRISLIFAGTSFTSSSRPM